MFFPNNKMSSHTVVSIHLGILFVLVPRYLIYKLQLTNRIFRNPRDNISKGWYIDGVQIFPDKIDYSLVIRKLVMDRFDMFTNYGIASDE